MRVTGTLFLATLFCVTWEKVQWNVAGAVGIADVLTILFLVAFALEWGAPRFPRTTVTVLAIFAALLVIYLVGFFNIETKQSLDQWGKGMVKFVLHFLFLAAGVAYLARRSLAFYWRAVAALTLGLVANGIYGVLQLLAARAGVNLDHRVLAPLTLAVPYRSKLTSRALLVPLSGIAVVLLAIVWERRHYFEVLIRSRLETSGRSESAHFAVYDFVPQILHSHPLFGLGLNNFSIYYEFVTGKTNGGPHSFYVAHIVETGVVGTLAFLAFIGYVFWRVRVAIRLGKALAAAGDWVAVRVRPLAWGLTAALVGTMASNFFYLTMQFYYFYAFVMLALAVPIVFGRRLESSSA